MRVSRPLIAVVLSSCMFLLLWPPLASRSHAQIGVSSGSIAEEARQLRNLLQTDLLPSCPSGKSMIDGVADRLVKLAERPSAKQPIDAVDRQLLEKQKAIDDLQSRQDALALEVQRRQTFADDIGKGNVDAVLAALRTGRWLPVQDARTALVHYASDHANTVDVRGVTLTMTPFGYFEYDPVVQMKGSRGSATLVFRPLNFFDVGTVGAALRAGMFSSVGLQASAAYGEGSQAVTIEPDAQQTGLVRDLGSSTPQIWSWSLRKGYRPTAEDYDAAFRLTEPGGKDLALIKNKIHVDGWLGGAWETAKEFSTALSMVLALMTFVAGKRDWDQLFKDWMNRGWQQVRQQWQRIRGGPH